ncbi:hypothetical protein D3C87_111480 [compost metagenome]
MARQEDKLSLSKKGKREVSSFIGHELLYDYLSNSLDGERKAAVADHIKFSRDAQLDLAKIQNGQGYAEQLADTVVSQPIIDQINAPATYLTVLMQKSNFDKWPQGLKWGLEALVVVAVIVSLLTIAPWEKIINVGLNSGSKEVILAEVTKTPQTSIATRDEPEFVDEDLKITKPEPVKLVPVSVVPTPKVAPAPVVPVAPVAKAPEPAKPAPIEVAGPAAEAPAASASPAASGGFLYRGEIAVTNIEVVGPKIKDKITELGGRKAGDVELGWKKTEHSMYYHFTIPEAKHQELLTFLSAYGTPKLNKEKHPRVMPDGILRLIITVDEAKQ